MVAFLNDEASNQEFKKIPFEKMLMVFNLLKLPIVVQKESGALGLNEKRKNYE